MEMDIEELKRLSGMPQIDEQGPDVSEMLGRMEGYIQDLKSIYGGRPGSGQGVISAIENILAVIKPSFPK